MIQRIQSVWLLLAAGCAALMFFLPIYGGVLQSGAIKNFLGSSNYLLFLVEIVFTALPLICLFLFKNRQLQLKLTFLHVLLGIALMAMVYFTVNNFITDPVNLFKSSSYKVAAALPVVSIILSIMAYRGINADEKLVRSTNRLR